MTTSRTNQKPPDILVEILNDLDAPSLRAVRTYVDQRLEDLRPSLQERIRSEANGEVVDITDCGAYTLVRTYRPSHGNYGRSSRPLSLYRVKRERRLNGEETLHWSFLGDVVERSGIECENCGTLLDTHRTVCPSCGDEARHHKEEL